MTGENEREGRGPDGSAADTDLSARLKRLDARLDQHRPADAPPDRAEGQGGSGPSPLGSALRLSTEFVAGIVAGGLIGWLFDRWLSTSPWGLIVFVMLGFGAGIYNAMRAAGFVKSASVDRQGS
jgi:ATP synthase protein I